ncbi:MAG: EF-Tu/IF-2/RF-3 family GTPase, partial [Pikeienuella sp.]
FVALDANEEQLDFPVLYASGRAGWADTDMDGPQNSLKPLFDLICEHVPAPAQVQNVDQPFTMLATTLEADPFLGRVLTGRIETGSVSAGDAIKALTREGKEIERFRVSKVLAFRGLSRQPVERAYAGDLVALAGMQKPTVADTLCDTSVNQPIDSQPVDPPTISVTFGINDSPLAGKDGDKVQSRVIRNRLMREAEGNVALRVADSAQGDAFEVSGRGELQMGVLIETMRREGFELSISRPRVLFREIDGVRHEPIEEVTVDVDEEYAGAVVEKLTMRKGELQAMRPGGGGKTRIVALAPSRGLIGYHGEFLTDTRGAGVMSRIFHSWAPHKGTIAGRRHGVLISMDQGQSVAYALFNLEDRGKMFIGAGEAVYEGMIIGENARPGDLIVNPLKGKKLSNVRASGKDEAVVLTTPVRMSLEEAIAYLGDDELLEVTPNNLRLRKRLLNPHDRKRESRSAGA